MGMEIPEHIIANTDAETSQQAAPTQGDHLPRILVAGPPNVGKRAVLQRLLALGKSKGSPFTSSGLLCHGCTIDTKYYTVDVCISTACLTNDDTNEIAKEYAHSSYCQALVLVFDLSNFSTFEPVREWVSTLQLDNLEVLLCIGNKADRLPDHFAHAEYRRRLQKRGESSSDPHPEFWDFGIQPSDGSRLLSDEGNSLEEIRSQCREWCTDNGIEYLEACAVDQTFDKCMSVDGDNQGISRVWDALSAHIWPGMTMKADQGLAHSMSLHSVEDESSDEESEISIGYERLSNGSADLWDGDEGPWTFYSAEQPMEHGSSEPEAVMMVPTTDTATHNSTASAPESASNTAAESSSHNNEVSEVLPCDNTKNVNKSLPDDDDECSVILSSGTHSLPDNTEKTIKESSSSSVSDTTGKTFADSSSCSLSDNTEKTNGNSFPEISSGGALTQATDNSTLSSNYPDSNVQAQTNDNTERLNGNGRHENNMHKENDTIDFEQLMMEMARMRENARSLSDSQRRDMAANLALQMAALFDEDD